MATVELSATDINKIADRVIEKMEDAIRNVDTGLGFQVRRAPWAYPVETGVMAITAFKELLDDVEAIRAKVESIEA